MAQLDAADSMPGNWLGLRLGLVNNNLKVKLLKVGLALSWQHRSIPDPYFKIKFAVTVKKLLSLYSLIAFNKKK